MSGGRDQKFLVWKVENQNDNAIKLVWKIFVFPMESLNYFLELKVDGHTMVIVNQFLPFHLLKVFD